MRQAGMQHDEVWFCLPWEVRQIGFGSARTMPIYREARLA